MMPIYEFKCENCGKINIRSLGISSKQETVMCDYCKEYKAKRIISQSSFMLKGGGWYVEGYNKKKEE